MDPTLLIALVVTLGVSAAVVIIPGIVADRQDTIVRAVRTALQTALGLLLVTLTSDALDMSLVTNVATPAVVTAATIIHAAIQPAEQQ